MTTTAFTVIRGALLTTMEKLRGLNGEPGQAIYLAGYHAADDGGGGWFHWEETTVTGEDGGTIIVPDDPRGRWVRVFDPAAGIQVAWFGAIGTYDTSWSPGHTITNSTAIELARAVAIVTGLDLAFAPIAKNTLTIYQHDRTIRHPVEGLIAWAADTIYTVNTVRRNGGNFYLCITYGQSASSGGPTTTSEDIADGTAHWKYLGPERRADSRTGMVGGRNVVLYHTNAGHCVDIDAGSSGLVLGAGLLTDAFVRDLIIRGAPSTVEAGARQSNFGLYVRGVHQGQLERVRIFAVTDAPAAFVGCTSWSGDFKSTINADATEWDPTPVNGMLWAKRPADPVDWASSMSSFKLILEGMSGAALKATDGGTQLTVEAGSTLEGCGKALEVDATSGQIVLDNTQHADNSECDFDIAGYGCEIRSAISVPRVQTISAVDAGANTLATATAHGYSVGDGPLVLSTTGVAPGNLPTATPYWVQATPTTTTFTLAASDGGGAIDISDAGSGVHSVRAPSVKIRDTARANIFVGGLYYGAIDETEAEYSQRYDLLIDEDSCVAGTVTRGLDRRIWVNGNLGTVKRWAPGLLPEHADDAAAAIGGLQVGEMYRTGSAVKVRSA